MWEGRHGIVHEADICHVEIVVDQLGLKDAKPATTPSTKDEGRIQSGMGVKSPEAEV